VQIWRFKNFLLDFRISGWLDAPSVAASGVSGRSAGSFYYNLTRNRRPYVPLPAQSGQYLPAIRGGLLRSAAVCGWSISRNEDQNQQNEREALEIVAGRLLPVAGIALRSAAGILLTPLRKIGGPVLSHAAGACAPAAGPFFEGLIRNGMYSQVYREYFPMRCCHITEQFGQRSWKRDGASLITRILSP
jgi:hypothetical protein